MSKDTNPSRAEAKLAALSKLLGDEKIDPLTLNPSEKGQHKTSPAERRRLIAQGLRKRRNDVLYAMLTNPRSPMGESR
jgi:hypothetical protein